MRILIDDDEAPGEWHVQTMVTRRSEEDPPPMLKTAAILIGIAKDLVEQARLEKAGETPSEPLAPKLALPGQDFIVR